MALKLRPQGSERAYWFVKSASLRALSRSESRNGPLAKKQREKYSGRIEKWNLTKAKRNYNQLGKTNLGGKLSPVALYFAYARGL